MMLYTVIPEEFIFAVGEEERLESSQLEIEFKMGKICLIGKPLPNGRFRITRMISTNSQDYLDPRWNPGTVF
jgi:hypothetical protein